MRRKITKISDGRMSGYGNRKLSGDEHKIQRDERDDGEEERWLRT